MRLQRIIEQMNYRPWFISAEGYASVRTVIEKAIDRRTQDGFNSMVADLVNPRPEMQIDDNGIATIHVQGVLGQHLTNVEKTCGNTGYEQVVEEAQIANEKADGAVFVIDSPGGMAVGAQEAASAISNMTIPTAAFTDSLSASAGYYLASGADYLVASPSAVVGSIGTILPWVDSSKQWDLQGIEFDPIINDGADLKDTMHGPSLASDQREFLQEHVNDLAAQFQDHVASHREVDDEVWRAGFYIGDRAVDMNLVDDVGSLELAHEFASSAQVDM